MEHAAKFCNILGRGILDSCGPIISKAMEEQSDVYSAIAAEVFGSDFTQAQRQQVKAGMLMAGFNPRPITSEADEQSRWTDEDMIAFGNFCTHVPNITFHSGQALFEEFLAQYETIGG